MSKPLESNKRWESSRMMLPEHREQYLNTKHKIVGQQLPTKEELDLIRDSILLPMMLSIIEKNSQEIEQSNYSMKKLYIQASNLLMKKIHSHLVHVRKQLRTRNIRVFEEEYTDSAIIYRYICRNYEDRIPMVKEVMRAEIGRRISGYISSLFTNMQN